MIILGLHDNHSATAALLVDGEVIDFVNEFLPHDLTELKYIVFGDVLLKYKGG